MLKKMTAGYNRHLPPGLFIGPAGTSAAAVIQMITEAINPLFVKVAQRYTFAHRPLYKVTY
jgi:hypothetical protein